jgi:pseudouridine-5'-phosphate glycosidase
MRAMTIPFLQVSPEVARAIHEHQPVVALETAVVTHGLPAPHNLEIAMRCEAIVRAEGAVPATVAMLEGGLRVGLSAEEIERLAANRAAVKISRRDIATVHTRGESGGTTVAATLVAAEAAGVRVFATGGIGGVHRDPHDVSADLPELARARVVVVCAGAKSILDLPATLEVLETYGIPVLGYQTDSFPAFYSRDSGLRTSARVESEDEAAAFAQAHWQLPRSGGVLLTVPCPVDAAMALAEVEQLLREALNESQKEGVRGNLVTPFLLAHIARKSGGKTLSANLALLRNNALHAARLAVAISRLPAAGM